MSLDLYLDIETIPTQSDAVRREIAAGVTPPSNYKVEATIKAWEREQKPALVSNAVAKTALDGALGHICCIGYAIDDAGTQAIVLDTERSEADVLDEFIAAIDAVALPPAGMVRIIGHNVAWFDIRFLWQRCMALGVRAPHWLPRDPKPWEATIFDTMTAWAGSRGTISLDDLCRALGLPGKADIDGSMVGQLWTEGKYQTIADYCRADVERVRNVHRKMRVALGEAA
ncbi:MAG: hypothetical protein ACTHKQ_25665 [Mesorhizobium sp.]